MPDEPQDEVIVREFQAELSEGDGRTIDARIVPYNTPTRVVDTVDNGGNGIPYTETWLPGAFDRQTGAVNRVKVWLNFEHQPGLQGIIGHGATLESRDDALYGTFRVHENADGDKALQMVREGILTGISLEAKPLRSRRLGDVVERLRAHLEKVSLCRIGAYEDATVLAVREPPDAPLASFLSSSSNTTSGSTYIVGEAGPELSIPVSAGTIELDETEPDELDPEPAPELALVGRMQVEAVKAELERTSLAEESLQRIGYEPLLVRAISREPWDGSAARFTDEQYEASCLVLRDGDAPLKERASLPILEPDGTVNANALANAAAVLTGARGGLRGVSPEQKSAAARKLIRFHSQAGMEPSSVLRQVAAR